MASADFARGIGLSAPSVDKEEYEDRMRAFSTYMHNNREEWQKELERCIANNQYRVRVDLKDLDMHMLGVSAKVLANPVKYILPWEEALMAFFRDINEKGMKQLQHELKLDLQGSFGANHVTPRGLTSNMMHQLVCIEGIVTKAAAAEPKLVQSVHVRKNGDGTLVSRDQRDATAFREDPNAGAMPQTDVEGFELEMEVGLSVYKDQQKFTLQEAPDHCPPGQIPRSVDVICDADLCDKAKPGDRVQVIGVFRGFPPRAADFTTGIWPSRVIGTSVSLVKDLVESGYVPDDLKNIRMIAERNDAFELLSRSFAPSICGHENVKAGLLLQLVGGTEKNLDNGTHLRGDINVLLVGDPSCGKSQMLRFVMNTAPNAVTTTGRGSSGVGLTAAMLRDPGSRDFHLEAGAMVLADRGVICIDEFDKMQDADRVAMHEAMEQQCVTIAKAGMHVTLNARCSVTAAANPKNGTFDPSLDLNRNLNMPDSLLSRFDLIYIVRDNTNEAIDKRIAKQVLDQSRMLVGGTHKRGVEQVHSSIVERRAAVEDTKAQEASEVFQKRSGAESGTEVVTVDFLRKYVRYCKRFTPVLSDAASKAISEKYVDLRLSWQTGRSNLNDPEEKDKKKLAVTTRTLEAMIRLATAHAKLKLRREEILPEDVEVAYTLMLKAREEEVPVPRPALDADDDADGGDDAGDDGAGPGGAGSRKRGRDGAGPVAGEPPAQAPRTEISMARYRVLETLVGRCFGRAQLLSVMDRLELLDNVNAELSEGEEKFTDGELRAGLRLMESNNKIMFEGDDEDQVTLVL